MLRFAEECVVLLASWHSLQTEARDSLLGDFPEASWQTVAPTQNLNLSVHLY